jgi:hypothetical protein
MVVVVFSLQLNLIYILPSFMVLEFKKKFTILDLRFQFDHTGLLNSLGFFKKSMFVRLINALFFSYLINF